MQLIEGAFEETRLVPLRSRNALTAAIPSLAARFPTARSFAEATLEEVLSPARMAAASRFAVTTLESGVMLLIRRPSYDYMIELIRRILR